jgi:hypothetical protein
MILRRVHDKPQPQVKKCRNQPDKMKRKGKTCLHTIFHVLLYSLPLSSLSFSTPLLSQNPENHTRGVEVFVKVYRTLYTVTKKREEFFLTKEKRRS